MNGPRLSLRLIRAWHETWCEGVVSCDGFDVYAGDPRRDPTGGWHNAIADHLVRCGVWHVREHEGWMVMDDSHGRPVALWPLHTPEPSSRSYPYLRFEHDLTQRLDDVIATRPGMVDGFSLTWNEWRELDRLVQVSGFESRPFSYSNGLEEGKGNEWRWYCQWLDPDGFLRAGFVMCEGFALVMPHGVGHGQAALFLADWGKAPRTRIDRFTNGWRSYVLEKPSGDEIMAIVGPDESKPMSVAQAGKAVGKVFHEVNERILGKGAGSCLLQETVPSRLR